MKIDLHCHTKKTKKGDSPLRNVTPELFKEKVELADVKIIGITNHNAFDIKQYKELKNVVANECQVWPGIEIDVIGMTSFHLLVICRPEDVERFEKSVNALFKGETPDSASHSLDEICATFHDYEALYIPHFHDKKPAISEEDKEKLFRLVNDDSRIFIEPRNHRTLGVLANKDYSVLIGSDVQDWGKYEESTFADLRLPVKSFSEFLLLSRRDKKVVKTLLEEKKPIEVICSPHPSVSIPVSIYPEINVIFGAKGTGKSKILESMYKDMQAKGFDCRIYTASERSEKFSMFTDIKDMDVDLKALGIDSCEFEFQELQNWKDANPGNFANYINWYRTRGNSNNKQRMRITEAVRLPAIRREKYSVHKTDAMEILAVNSAMRKITVEEYLTSEDSTMLSRLMGKLMSTIKQVRKEDLVDEQSIELVNYSIDRIKSIADRSSDTISRPSTTGFSAFVDRRLQLFHIVTKILKTLEADEKNSRVKIGSLDGKGDIFVNYKYRMICEKERTANFPGYKITELKAIKNDLLYIQSHYWEDDITSRVSDLVTKCEENKVSSIKAFVGRSKQIITADGNEYQPSNGEQGILLLEQTLQNDADAFFLDEPELGMGNAYIDTDIRPMITKLAKKRKYVVIATHNANIAVRTLPYMSIFRNYENGIYKTYVGNPFDDQLINLEDMTDVKSWTEESMHSLEGGREAFYERRDIYESKDD